VSWLRLFRQLGIAVSGSALAVACAPPSQYEQPTGLRAYEILVVREDSLGRELAQGLRRRGFTVRREVHGGSRPTAYLFVFTYRAADPPAVMWLHVRLADTRTGAIVATISAPLDALGASTAVRAQAIVDSLAANPALKRPQSPS
jgi:hypothetical protein